MASRAHQGQCQSRHDSQGADTALKRRSPRCRERRDHGEPALARTCSEVGAARCGATAFTRGGRAHPPGDAHPARPGDRRFSAGATRRRRYTLPAPGTPQTRQRDALIVSILAYAGLRPANCALSGWRDSARTRSSCNAPPTPDGSSKPTKNRQHRTVRLLSALAQDVREYTLAIGRPPEKTLILLDDDRRPWDKNAWQMWRVDRWAPACRAAGLDPIPRPYDLRHSFASLLLAEGKQPIWCAKQLGHTVAVFLSTYAHLIDEFEDRERIDAEAEIAKARREVGTRLVRTTPG